MSRINMVFVSSWLLVGCTLCVGILEFCSSSYHIMLFSLILYAVHAAAFALCSVSTLAIMTGFASKRD